MSRPLASLGGHYSESACRTSLKIAFENGPGADERRAKGMGRDHAELAARKSEGAMERRNSTRQRRRSTFVPQTTVVPGVRQSAPENSGVKISEQEVAAKFAAVVTPLSKDDLADVSGRSSEAAKHWKAASRAPNSSSLITMARQLPVVRNWLISEIDMPQGAATGDPGQAVNAVMKGLQLAANLPGQEGVIARTLLSKLQQGDG